ncbi:hypothetical protein L2E82_33776 [Cichorium intybus]|uniref:Uncharacterized protein n=1 Tax=Cichorium intybus TaxID=13427 RepID=A0ACB9BLF7_CICIN|nr:hypothetical protein L2E82_33776 [Cichorium intybus]
MEGICRDTAANQSRFAKRTDSRESDVDMWLFTASSGVSAKSCIGGEMEDGGEIQCSRLLIISCDVQSLYNLAKM